MRSGEDGGGGAVTRKTLARNFILIVFSIFFLGQGTFWLWTFQRLRSEEASFLKEKMQNTAGLLASLSAPALAAMDNQGVQNQVDALPADADLVSVKVTDKDGNSVAGKTLKAVQEDSAGRPLFLLPPVLSYKQRIEQDGSKLGSVEVVFSSDRANSKLKKFMAASPFAQVLISLLIIYAVFFFFQKRIGKPIEELNSKLDSITEGDLTVEIEKYGDDEIGAIAAGLDFMRRNLSESVRRLNSTASNVGMAIKQMNFTFKNVSGSMGKQANSVDDIATALRSAAEAQKKIARGTEQLSEFSTENVTSLLEVKATADEIASSTGRLFQAVEDSYSALSQFSQSAKKIAENAREGLRSIEDTSASVDEISASVKEIDRNARESTQLAEKVKTIAAEQGVLVIADIIVELEKTADVAAGSVEGVTRLEAKSKDIEKMLMVIKDVTEQTNLLSLNAAILAVQAGEYGKGFSVVAEEIRALSERTAASTKEIAQIVKTLQNEIAQVVTSTEDVMRKVEQNKEEIYKAGSITANVVEASQGAAAMALSTQKATEEQVKGLAQISAAVDNIRALIESMAGATEEQSKSSSYMLEKMGDVKEIAESTKKGTREQAEGTRHITGNLELANERIKEIKDFVGDQDEMNSAFVGSMDQIRQIGIGTMRQTEEIALSLGTLQGEIEALTREMEKYRTNGKIHTV